MLFERLFLRYMNQLYLHLRTINIFPVDIALSWISSFFFDVLSIDNSFVLIDRIMGYGSLLILPVLALSIFKYYEKQLLEVEDRGDIDDLFVDIPELNVLEVLNYFLFYSQ